MWGQKTEVAQGSVWPSTPAMAAQLLAGTRSEKQWPQPHHSSSGAVAAQGHQEHPPTTHGRLNMAALARPYHEAWCHHGNAVGQALLEVRATIGAGLP